MDKTIDRWTDSDGNGYAFKDTVARAQNRATIDKMNAETADRKTEVNTERKRIDNLIANGTAQTQEIGKTIVQTKLGSSNMNMDYLAADKYYSGLFDGITFKDTDFFYIPSESGSGADYVGKLLKPGLYHMKFRVKISKDGGLPEIAMRIILKKGSTTIGEYSELKTEYIIFPQTSSSTNMRNVEYIFAITEPTYIKLFVTSIADGTGTFGFNASECTITAIDWKGKQSANLSELHDLRIGADGVVHNTAGEAVRKQIGNLTEDLVAYKKNITDTETRELSSIVDNGVYGVNKTTIGFLDTPDGIDDSWKFATLVVEKCLNGYYVLQTFYDSSLYDNPFYRLVDISTKTQYKGWERAYKADENYRTDNSASSIITKLSDFRSAGSVGIDQALSEHLTDIPTYFQGGAFTLFNIPKSFNGYFVTQFIFDTNISSKTIYARIISSSDGTTYRDWVKLGEETASNKNVLTNKKWVACGDSFTEGVDGEKFTEGVFTGKNKVYPFFIGERNNMTIVNEAVSGSSMTYISERHDSWENGCFSINRYKNIPKDADYITLYFGINDDNYSAPVGTIADTKNTTFYGAWNIVLEYLIENHPFAKIGIIITNGSSKKYTDAERAISRKWGIPYLDMEADYQHVPLMQRVTERTEVCQKVLELRKKAFAVSDSNTHPNAKAHEYESTFIENWLRTL